MWKITFYFQPYWESLFRHSSSSCHSMSPMFTPRGENQAPMDVPLNGKVVLSPGTFLLLRIHDLTFTTETCGGFTELWQASWTSSRRWHLLGRWAGSSGGGRRAWHPSQLSIECEGDRKSGRAPCSPSPRRGPHCRSGPISLDLSDLCRMRNASDGVCLPWRNLF